MSSGCGCGATNSVFCSFFTTDLTKLVTTSIITGQQVPQVSYPLSKRVPCVATAVALPVNTVSTIDDGYHHFLLLVLSVMVVA